MILAEAVKLVKHHQSMLSTIDEYTDEYISGLQDPLSPDYAIKFSEALEIVLKGAAVQDGKSQDFKVAS